MNAEPLPFRAPLGRYLEQANALLAALEAGDPEAARFFHERHPRFLEAKIPWLPRKLAEAEIRSAGLTAADAQLAVARRHSFLNWETLAEHVHAVTQDGSPVCLFESAVEAVISGNLEALRSLLRANPELVRARSSRVTHFDPPVHRATLLHYVAANGVEGHRQKTPKNAVEIATALLTAGAEVDALADLYGGQCTTMSLLVSSCHPAEAGVQVLLAETLIDFGAAVEPRGSGKWTSPLFTALVFGYRSAAVTLVRHGAKVDNLAVAAGLGRLAEVRQMLPAAGTEDRHRALALAAQLGQAAIVRLLLDAGEDPDRYNPDGMHSHSTPLHQAALAGHEPVVRLLVKRGARLDMEDAIYHSTPQGWAAHGGHAAIAELLRGQLAPPENSE